MPNLIETRRNLASLTIGDTTFGWHRITTGHDGGTGWLHSGIAVAPDGSLLVAHPEGRDLICISPSGAKLVVQTPLTEMHCLVVGIDSDQAPLVWAADNGHRFVHGTPTYGEVRTAGRVVALTVDGDVARELPDPNIGGPWSPTSVALADPADPLSDVWVADGYGQSLIHRYRADGTLVMTLDGNSSGQRFDCPHGIMLRQRESETELYVADRSNRRVVVFDLEGSHLRTIGAEVLDSPSSMIDYRGSLLVTELFGAIAVFDQDIYAGHIGASGRDHTAEGWPNRIEVGGQTVAPTVTEGVFNSPHGICTDQTHIYVTEWFIGGRVVRLDPGTV